MSSEPDTTRFPSGGNLIELTQPEGPSSSTRISAESRETCHTRTTWPTEPVAINLPSAEKAAELTQLDGLSNRPSSLPVPQHDGAWRMCTPHAGPTNVMQPRSAESSLYVSPKLCQPPCAIRGLPIMEAMRRRLRSRYLPAMRDRPTGMPCGPAGSGHIARRKRCCSGVVQPPGWQAESSGASRYWRPSRLAACRG